ncbi:MAG: hypothetical protein ACR2NN_19005 [Bryobacteraceae bacterium]
MHDLGDRDAWRDQKVYLICHYDIGVEFIVIQPLLVIENGFNHQIGDLPTLKVQWAGAGAIQNTIHANEGLSGRQMAGERAVGRQAAV